ncbi:MAG: hypothetical protein JNL01_13020 [Bdellovibrionales bacterium]|nr:hypothetical protein [Bdellovibrionales bacterium]
MKFWILLGCVFASTSALGQTQPKEIHLGQLGKKDAVPNSDQVIVVRDHLTSKKVTLYLDIDYDYEVCLREGTRMVYGQDASCGYDTHYESRETCTTTETCDVWKNGECRSTKSETSCSTESVPVEVMRSCYYPETYCAETGTETQTISRRLFLKFNKMHELRTGEEERFHISGRQSSYDSFSTTFDVKVLNAVEKTTAKVRTAFNDRIVFKSKNRKRK